MGSSGNGSAGTVPRVGFKIPTWVLAAFLLLVLAMDRLSLTPGPLTSLRLLSTETPPSPPERSSSHSFRSQRVFSTADVWAGLCGFIIDFQIRMQS